MRTALIAAGMAALLGGCETLGGERGPPPIADGRYACDATAIQPLIGQEATTDLGAEAMRGSRARTVRWIRPGTAVTMDYRNDRLNIEVDAQNRVTALRCG